jgi:5'-3' exonuclease
MSHQLLLDTSSLMYRAFFALPQSITDAAGEPINAVHGYLDMTARLLDTHAPDELIHVYDHDWRPAARVAAYAGYKADRPADPPALPPQFAVLRDVLTALGMVQAEVERWEADDAIGSLCSRADPQQRLDIVTGDRDLLQLVRDGDERSPTVRVLYTRRGVTELDIFDADAVVEKYGVSPQEYVDFAMLRGDPSDGLPGVKGVGEKTAARLVQQYGSVAEILAHVDALSPKLASNLSHARAYLAAMQTVVPIRTDLAVTIRRPAGDPASVSALAERYQLGGPLARVQNLQD